MQQPWLHFWGCETSETKRGIAEALAAAGIPVRPLEPVESSNEGILCFASVGTELLSFVRDVTGNGTKRILAIPISGEPLGSSQAWRLLQSGASDVLQWSSASTVANQVKARFERWRAVDEMLAKDLVRTRLIGNGTVWRGVLRQIVEVAGFTAASMLLIGESGTGKEMIARLIHELSAGAEERSLIVVDCTTIVPELSGSEFFGHERGAFTGAIAARDGAFALADGGTLFLDEVGELPLHLQAQLLRVVQEGTYKRVGGNAWQRTKFRLVCATNKDLPRLVEAGKFRADLYFRIAGWVFRIPPLRERTEDILPLARHFLSLQRPDAGTPDFEPAVKEFLVNRCYPGNVRDLRQLITRISSRHVGKGAITAGDIPEDERPNGETETDFWQSAECERWLRRAISAGIGLKDIGRVATETAIRLAIDEEGGNLQMAARRLGVTDRALQMRRAAQRSLGNGG